MPFIVELGHLDCVACTVTGLLCFSAVTSFQNSLPLEFVDLDIKGHIKINRWLDIAKPYLSLRSACGDPWPYFVCVLRRRRATSMGGQP